MPSEGQEFSGTQAVSFCKATDVDGPRFRTFAGCIRVGLFRDSDPAARSAAGRNPKAEFWLENCDATLEQLLSLVPGRLRTRRRSHGNAHPIGIGITGMCCL
jgi:hypothetical protein